MHVLSPAELNVTSELPDFWMSGYLPTARQSIQRVVRNLGLMGIEPPEILVQPIASTGKAAEALAEHAEKIGAEMILVGTHARHGISRVLLGSFAESLLLRSRVPVLTVSCRSSVTGDGKVDLGRMLFPTGFAAHAKDIFRRAVGLAKGMGSAVTVYHAIPRPMEPLYHSGVYMLGSPYMIGTPWLPLQKYYDREEARQRHRVEAWARWARHQGIEADSLIQTEVSRIAEGILQAARERKAGWIAMASYHGPWAAALLGSVTRQVVREAECPVWVMHPPKRAETQAPGDVGRAA